MDRVLSKEDWKFFTGTNGVPFVRILESKSFIYPRQTVVLKVDMNLKFIAGPELILKRPVDIWVFKEVNGGHGWIDNGQLNRVFYTNNHNVEVQKHPYNIAKAGREDN